MSRRAGVLQSDVGPELLEEVKREAEGLGLSVSSYVRMLVKQRTTRSRLMQVGPWPLSEKGGSKKARAKRSKMTASSRERKP